MSGNIFQNIDSEMKISPIQSQQYNQASQYFQKDYEQSPQYNYFKPNQNNTTQNNIKQQGSSQIINQKSIEKTSSKQNTSLNFQVNNQQFANTNQKPYEIISIQQSQYDYLLLLENLLFYCKSPSPIESQNLNKQSTGKLYHTLLDENMNPKFITQEGSFKISLSDKKFLLNGQGKEYIGKSTIIKNKGYFENGHFQENEIKSQRSKSAPIKRIIIIDVQTGQQVNKNKQIQNYYSSICCQLQYKFNQQFGQQDLKILENSRRLTSSIIDGYVFYLNLQSEKSYYQQNKNINRILFLPTTLTTNFGINYTDQHAQQLFETELLQFQELNYELKYIYSQVGIPVNQNNFHWYFLHFDLKQQTCTIFDSLQQPTSHPKTDQKLISTLGKLLKIQKLQRKLSEYSGQQNDGYSCGYHVCQFMKYCQESQFQSNLKYTYNQSEITQILLKIIKY